jgi:hypothetical protein
MAAEEKFMSGAHGLPHNNCQAISHVMQKSIPAFGIVSIAIPLLGLLGLIIGTGVDTGLGAVVALFCLAVTPVLGLVFGVTAIVRRERFGILPIAGLIGSVLFILWYWRLIW